VNARARIFLVVFAGMLYAASFFLPVAKPLKDNDMVFDGTDAFEVGWNALISFKATELECWVLAGAWFANPLIWVAMIAMIAGIRSLCRWSSVAAAVWCLFALVNYSFIAFLPGFWFWLATAIVLFVGSLPRWPDREQEFVNH
jgi:hypothetical protein